MRLDNSMSFKDDLAFEEYCYKGLIKPYLLKCNVDSIFIRYNKKDGINSIVYNYFQKENDIT